MDYSIENFPETAETRVDPGALDQSASNSRKLYIWWWWTHLMSVMLARLYVSAHFPHQCLIGSLLGAFFDPTLCIYVTDPFIWMYGYHGSYHTSRVAACPVLSTLATAVIAGLTHWSLKLCGWDPHWTIKLILRWCENPESISVSMKPMYALIVSTSSLLGRALCVTPTVAETPTMVPEAEVVTLDKEYYDMSGEKVLIILNQRKFRRTKYFNRKKPPTRNGTNEDRNKLKKLYEQLGFTVIVMQDHQYHSIIQKLTANESKTHGRR